MFLIKTETDICWPC